MELTMSVDWATIVVIIGLGSLLWRHLSNLDKRLSSQMSELTAQVGRVSERLAHLEGVIMNIGGRNFGLGAAGVETRQSVETRQRESG